MIAYEEVYTEEKLQALSKEFSRLHDSWYVDHTGATLYAKSQIEAVGKDLQENLYGNPHALSLSSKHTTDEIDQIRYRILRHFNTNPEEYSVIFTSGATGALKTVAECFNWTGAVRGSSSFQNSSNVNYNLEKYSVDKDKKNDTKDGFRYDGKPGAFVYLEDNHTSVLGMRELAKEKSATVKSITQKEGLNLFCKVEEIEKCPCKAYRGNSLFVYPAQCNFSGLKYPLSWIKHVQDGTLNQFALGGERNEICKTSKWFCFLDAATYVSTNPLDLSSVKPDFVCASFYKIFGYPSGLGALLVRNSSAFSLNKKYFGGGTVLISLSSQQFHVSRPVLHEKFEDGTASFLSILALRHGFDTLHRLTGDFRNVSEHTFHLARYFHHSLLSMHHSNGTSVAVIYCDTDFEDRLLQGSIVNFNLMRPTGEFIGFAEILHMANLHNIHLRTGCFCNPGACQRHLNLSVEDLKHHFESGHVCGDEKDVIDGQPTGSVRVSFGYMSTREDADKVLTMIRSCFVQEPAIIKIPEWWSEFQQQYREKFYPHVNLEISQDDNSIIKHETQTKDCEKKVLPTIQEPLSKQITSTDTNEGDITLNHIFLYPIKSCGAFSAQEWVLGSRGLLYDREWMIVTPSGVCVTQKQDTHLCMVKPTIDLEEKKLWLSFPGLQSIWVPLRESEESSDPNSVNFLCQSKVCGDRILGWDCGDEVADWLSQALNKEGLRLIHQWQQDYRVAKPRNQEAQSEKKLNELSLANQAQFLMINVNSIQWLADKVRERQGPEGDSCGKDELIDRFRSNLVVSGAKMFSENEWKKLHIGTNIFKVDGPCTRCQIVCINQSTGERTKEPLLTIAATFKGKMRFGIYLSHESASGEMKISVGDQISVTL